jgi:4-hydroxybenzoate polyprenyltransferase
MESDQLRPSGLWVHLRFPFSVLLMPVFWFGLWTIPVQQLNTREACMLFIILHLLVYPSSNGFNSIQDRDTGPIGLLEKPPMPSLALRPLTLFMDILAMVIAAWFLLLPATMLLLVYIIASRLYSWRPVRMKRFAVTGFLLVFFCQGALVFLITGLACDGTAAMAWIEGGVKGVFSFWNQSSALPPAFISSLLIGSMYPLTQIYQHVQDRQDGVQTLSARLGYHGTFLFSGLLFVLATLLLWPLLGTAEARVIFHLCLAPVPVYFLYWWLKVRKDSRYADFNHTMRMSVLSSGCLNLAFLLLLFIGHR